MGKTAALAVLLALSAPASAGTANPKLELRASSHGKTVRASAGSHCIEHGNRGFVCADYGYPLKLAGRAPVHPTGTLRLRFGAAPTKIEASLRNAQSEGLRAVPVTGSGRRWKATLPRRLRKADRLGVFVRYGSEDADFEVGLKRHRHD